MVDRITTDGGISGAETKVWFEQISKDLGPRRQNSHPERDLEIFTEISGGSTLEQSANAHGLTIERVRQIKAKVARMLRGRIREQEGES